MHKLTARSAFSYSLFLLVLSLPSCGGGGGGGGSVGGGGTGGGAGGIPSTPVSIDHSGVLAAAAGNAAVRLHLRRPPAGFESTVFHATTSAGLLAGTQVAVSGDTLTISGLVNGAERVFSLAIRPTGGSNWTLAGAALRARPLASAIYVDAAASAGGNGSLATPYRTLQEGLTAAGLAGTANVFVRDGSYTTGLVSPGTHVYGGFPTGSAFTIDNRNPLAGLTVVTAAATQAAFAANTVGARVILDGFSLAGNNVGAYGIDQQNIDLDAR